MVQRGLTEFDLPQRRDTIDLNQDQGWFGSERFDRIRSAARARARYNRSEPGQHRLQPLFFRGHDVEDRCQAERRQPEKVLSMSTVLVVFLVKSILIHV